MTRPTLINQVRLSFSRNYNFLDVLSDTHLSDLGSRLPVFGPKAPTALNISGRVNMGKAPD